jgi:hypothetical protein
MRPRAALNLTDLVTLAAPTQGPVHHRFTETVAAIVGRTETEAMHGFLATLNPTRHSGRTPGSNRRFHRLTEALTAVVGVAEVEFPGRLVAVGNGTLANLCHVGHLSPR